MAKKLAPAKGVEAKNALTVEQSTEETGAEAMARALLQPTLKNALAASAFASKPLGENFEAPGIGDYVKHVQCVTKNAAEGDLQIASELLAAQAIALDSMFAELARRSASNMGEYIEASERYGRLALKAQSNCRTTLEALAKLHLPREQTVRHVQVNDGGQAVIADEFHNHTGGPKNDKSVKQSHATNPVGESTALPCPDASGN